MSPTSRPLLFAEAVLISPMIRRPTQHANTIDKYYDNTRSLFECDFPPKLWKTSSVRYYRNLDWCMTGLDVIYFDQDRGTHSTAYSSFRSYNCIVSEFGAFARRVEISVAWTIEVTYCRVLAPVYDLLTGWCCSSLFTSNKWRWLADGVPRFFTYTIDKCLLFPVSAVCDAFCPLLRYCLLCK